MDFEKKVLKTIEKYNMLSPGDTVVVGLSGGADSVALFKVLCALKNKFNLTIHSAHINHMIRGDEAERDSDYAKKLSEENNIPFHLLKCDIPKMAKELGISEEMAGRKVRYEFFKKTAPDGKIAVAHHMGDSVETTIINMIRGSSLKGLKGISAVNESIIRPLIECSRDEIENYLEELGISYVTDSTNYEDIYTRNIIRNKIIPQMSEINPNLISTVFENSRLLQDDEDFISKTCKELSHNLIYKDEDKIILKTCHDIHISIKRRLIIECCRMINKDANISASVIESIADMETGGRIKFSGICAERSYNNIIFSEIFHEVPEFSKKITVPCTVNIPEISKSYEFKIVSKNEITAYKKEYIYLDSDKLGELTIRSRADGDAFSPLGMQGRKKVKDFLIDLKIPRFERGALPILESGGKIVAILCQRADEAYKVTDKTTKILMINEVQ